MKCVVKLKNCWIGTKIGVVVDIDPAQWHRVDTFVNNEQDPPMEDPAHCSRMCQLCATVPGIMIVVKKDKKAKIQKYKRKKRRKNKKTNKKDKKDKKTIYIYIYIYIYALCRR